MTKSSNMFALKLVHIIKREIYVKKIKTLIMKKTLNFRMHKSNSPDLFYLCMIHISQVIKSSSNANFISFFLTNCKVFPTTDHCILKLSQHFQSVSQVSGSLGLAKFVSHSSCKSEVVLVVLQCLHVVTDIKVSISKLSIGTNISSS